MFNVLNYRSRWYNPLVSLVFRIVRFFHGERIHPHSLVWLRHNGKRNTKLFAGDGAAFFWFTKESMENRLQSAGFKMLAFHYENDFEKNKITTARCILFV